MFSKVISKTKELVKQIVEPDAFKTACVISAVLVMGNTAYHVSSVNSTIKENALAFLNQSNDLYLKQREETKRVLLPILKSECSSLKNAMRETVYHINSIDAIGLFNGDGVVYCESIRGKNNLNFYKLLNVSKLPEEGLSLGTPTYINIRSIFNYFNINKDTYIGIVSPKHHLLDIFSKTLENQHLKYQLLLNEALLAKNTEQIDGITLQAKDFPLIIKYEKQSQIYLDYIFHNLVLLLVLIVITFIVTPFALKYLKVRMLQRDLKYAIENETIDVYFQAIVNSKTNSPIGCEALSRWKHSKLGYISPAVFIPIAEQFQLIDDLTTLVLKKCIQMIESKPVFFANRYVSMNISRCSILVPEFITQLEQILELHPRTAKHLVLEITEEHKFNLEQVAELKKNLKRIELFGPSFSVDDFGTGYAGLDFLRNHKFRAIKIDRAFIHNIEENTDAISLLESIYDMAAHLDLKVIVEGVENKEQLDIVQSIGFKYIQGFYYHKPSQLEAFKAHYMLGDR